MANPQKENGYTAISNEILEHLSKIRISGEAWQVLGVIIRQTYGFQKKEDSISLSQFVDKTEMRKPDICRALAKLLMMNLIVSKKANNKENASKYGLNKDYDTWRPLAKKLRGISKIANNHLQKSEKSLAKLLHTKEKRNIKETITKERQATPIEEAQVFFNLSESELSDFITRLAAQYHWERSPTEMEVKKFRNYWMEKDKLGRKQRWQDEKHFELKRRFATWFSRAKGNFKSNGGINNKYEVGKA